MRAGVIAIAAVVASGMASLARADSSFYVSGGVGGYFKDSDGGPDQFHRLEPPLLTASGTDRRGFDPGVIANVALGYRLFSHVRVEGELGYFTYTGDTLNPQTTAPGFPNLNGQTFGRASGDRFTRFTGTANVFYDFTPLAGRFRPYIGAGVGGSADHQGFGVFKAANGALFDSSGGSSTQGLGMVEGGVSIALTPHLSLVPAYRYVHFFASNEDVAHVAKIGLRYSF